MARPHPFHASFAKHFRSPAACDAHTSVHELLSPHVRNLLDGYLNLPVIARMECACDGVGGALADFLFNVNEWKSCHVAMYPLDDRRIQLTQVKGNCDTPIVNESTDFSAEDYLEAQSDATAASFEQILKLHGVPDCMVVVFATRCADAVVTSYHFQDFCFDDD